MQWSDFVVCTMYRCISVLLDLFARALYMQQKKKKKHWHVGYAGEV